jgi:succinate dehydrogenase / fumarate reductase iron-sulfur subunit/fumarate reductase iron-sulfur subunit
MVVNGREQLTCSTLIKDIGRQLRIEPLRNLPVTRDLAVDMNPFFAAYRRAKPEFTPREDLVQNEFYSLPHSGREWKSLNHQPQCVDCAACYSACTLVNLHRRYLGPMALHRSLTVLVDPRASGRSQRLDLVAGEAGAFRCHTLGNCRDVCPRGISPTYSIQRLKRLALTGWLTNWFKGLFSSSAAVGHD